MECLRYGVLKPRSYAGISEWVYSGFIGSIQCA